ncbi:hypothetical protein CSC15_3349 [Escherichia coli]|nr:hypothetical protein CSC15_3349 [Escherichia coli]
MAVISCHLAQVYAKCRSFMSKPFTIITFLLRFFKLGRARHRELTN